MPDGTAIFVDTSTQIARVIHGSAAKQRIEDRLHRYDITVTSEVVKQEFKRRLLSKAKSLLNQIALRGSITRVQRHVINSLPPPQSRKRNLCDQILTTLREHFPKADEEEVDRASEELPTQPLEIWAR